MPELPEVETVRRILEPQIAGRTVEKLTIRRPEVIAFPSPELFEQNITGQTAAGMNRRGKFLEILLKNGGRIVLHLRMTGCLLAAPPDYPEEKHTHIIFVLSGGMELSFSDTRRFGRFWYIAPNEMDSVSGTDKLGIEPFDERLTAGYLQKSFGRRTKSIKECLLEQGIVAGIGNIYSDEILFSAKINPRRPANSLTPTEWRRLCRMIPQRLSYYIDKNCITPQDYLAGHGRDYRNTPFLQVYGHDGEPCPVCQTTLCKTIQGGRSCVFCPKCQK